MRNQAPADKSPEFTAKQVRAARALLAWSQQELAKTAGVAASTVADFERGQRTPVPNNAEAIRTALTRAGVTFLPGGAVVGPPLPSLAALSKSGAPIRWVNATDLAQWAERRDGQSTLPTLIAKLIRAANGSATELRFPSDEGVQHAGWDGTTRSERETDYVPLGPAGWEFGTQREAIARKATDDYVKRTADPSELIPADSAFVFVTPRHWPKKGEWVRQKSVEGKWREVRAYDGDDLVHWIELYPAVGQWLATTLGKRPPGARQLEEVWLEWSLATQWPLTPELVLSDRDADAAAVLQWLRSASSAFSLQGETADEVAAFFYAAINQLPPEIAAHYEARCLVATTPDMARTLADSVTPLIIVLLDPEPGLAQLIAQRGHHVLLAYGGNADLRGDFRKLSRPSREGIEVALVDSGIATARARSLARESSRSLAVLRRLIPTAPGRLPEWAQQPPPHALLAALLAGAWDERSESDRAILTRLGNTPYDNLITELAPFVGTFDSPLRKVGTAWKVASPQDAWFLLARYLTSGDIERFEAAILDVLGSADPRFNMDPDERWLAPTRGVSPEYSAYLRHGLGEILILLALFPDRAPNITAGRPRAEYVVQQLLHNADRQRWWSLSRDFQLLAEASPDAFLNAIDQSLAKNDPPIAALFGHDSDPMFGSEHLSNLLWALESLAQAPEHLARVSEILAALDAVDPGGRYTNRPANSLRQIFLLWAPQTNATLDQRMRVLDRLRRSQPAPAWKLLLGILPSGHDSFSPSPLTRWRDFTADNPEVVTYGLIGKGAEAITQRLLDDVGVSAARWNQLLDRLSNLAPDRTAAIDKLVRVAPDIRDPDDRLALWDGLRRLLHHHRYIPDAGWALPEAELSQLEQVYEALAPADLVQRVAWLFSPSVSLPRPPIGGWESDQAKVAEERRLAVKALLDGRGVEGIFELARIVEMGGFIGAALAEIELDPFLRNLILTRALRSENPRDRNLAHGMVFTKFQQAKEPWAAEILARAMRENWGAEAVLTILGALPSRRWTWDQAHAAGEGIETLYWKRAATLWIEGEVADITFAVMKLVEVGRARHAIHLVGHKLKEVLPNELLVTVLMAAVREPWEKSSDHNEPVMFQHYVSEILNKLDQASDVPEDAMLKLEWAYLPVLAHSRRPVKVLLKALSENPGFFIDVLSAVFKPSEDSGIVEDPPADMEQAQAIATQAYDLLGMWNRIPGTKQDGTIDGAILEAWIKEARILADRKGRKDIADQKIGEMLSASPPEADGIWPAIPVREAIEIVRSRHIETGFVIGRQNRRGVTSRLPGSGGTLERAEAEKYREFARATALEWPHTSAGLERIAKDYEEHARWHDESAERMDWR